MVESVVFDWPTRTVRLLDQRRLPRMVDYVTCKNAGEVASAIAAMVVRGAPAIGIAAAYGLAAEAATAAKEGLPAEALVSRLERAGSVLVAARPTAVNLAWAVSRVLSVVRRRWEQGGRDGAAAELAPVAAEEASAILAEDRRANRRIGRLGALLVPEDASILTHCNAGALACGTYGTALGVIRAAVEDGRKVHVYACETRPYLQGSRLTAWELMQDRIPVTVIVDSAAAFLMARRRIDLVVVGADRIARNGDTANKVGTYGLAVLAHAHGVPFYVAAPWSTVDPATPSGREIPVEERSPDEVRLFAGQPVAADGVQVWNPSFDVTPGALLTAIITDRGVVRPPYDLGRAPDQDQGGE